MELDYLYRRPALAPAAAALLTAVFGPASGAPFYEELVRSSMTPGRLPLTLVAAEGERLLGTAGLWQADMLCRQDLWPWLGCLAVDPALRRRGVGRALQDFTLETARAMGFETVYLYTHLTGYYEKTGWQYLGQGYEPDGSPRRIYRRAAAGGGERKE